VTRIVGVGNQRVKECNRIAATVQALKASLKFLLPYFAFLKRALGVRHQGQRTAHWH
jgi:hypothetical protein